MGTRETWQIIMYQKRLFDLNSKGMGGFSGTTNYNMYPRLTRLGLEYFHPEFDA